MQHWPDERTPQGLSSCGPYYPTTLYQQNPVIITSGELQPKISSQLNLGPSKVIYGTTQLIQLIQTF